MSFSFIMMNILLGIGNEMNGDDAIGTYVARKFKCEGWKAIDCATVPENFTGEIRKHKPDKIIIVDAADMNLPPGEIRKIPKEKIRKVNFSTHTIPLSLFITHLEKTTDADIFLIGIQPKSMYGKVSNEVMEAGNKVIEYIKEGMIDKICEL